ncbi:hypothetical protein RSJ44_004724 [Yersinia enterocolitica]|uniref:hypothetical protein n=1 Tax=Yersinia enterocolitica TaxID=630 RepID=UPI0021E7D261|nr:hypothetical protein [Yersinia enterocolitica]EKN3948561.1 hypothetical protein [Yersinia enterocolitica]EKN3978677.1 hypothetical protein [Yersinia enterocolitica]EKN3987257.1 hypothetical protein [Yersinia enterocolitica]EKN5909071.1 hypothetical protein [Yersinia enterocolitica]EKN6318687.1 hypothetical protein [Yersinia enterocolitica]
MIKKYTTEESMWDEWPSVMLASLEQLRSKYPNINSDSWNFYEGWANFNNSSLKMNVSFTAFDKSLNEIILVNIVTTSKDVTNDEGYSVSASERHIVEYDPFGKSYVIQSR